MESSLPLSYWRNLSSHSGWREGLSYSIYHSQAAASALAKRDNKLEYLQGANGNGPLWLLHLCVTKWNYVFLSWFLNGLYENQLYSTMLLYPCSLKELALKFSSS